MNLQVLNSPNCHAQYSFLYNNTFNFQGKSEQIFLVELKWPKEQKTKPNKKLLCETLAKLFFLKTTNQKYSHSATLDL